MGFSDDERFSFDKEEIDWQPQRSQDALEGPYRDVYLNHLDLAVVLTQWAKNVRELPDYGDSKRYDGYADALDEVAAHLRQADYVPGNGEIPA
ncbi:hypothetical protein [Streptomyces dubilierae]|uniref:Uncharacterized protein n=1 Tax=Streptomyces dubilierae TaxID=3075533 RepID=A0ABU2P6T0_9ACTN|nr:hypothetical protein [Streptomyces sp. DSM 41921]MDT0387851.1 hypothetical protein [Streptomyces sp. DSM 41921]